MKTLRHALAALVPFAMLLVGAPGARSGVAWAQMGGGMGGRQNNTPTQSGPVQNRTVGPRAGGRSADDDDDDTGPSVSQHPGGTGEPLTAPPANPLEIPPELAARIGTDSDMFPPSPEGASRYRYFPYYEERKGDFRFRFLPPLWLEHTRGLPSTAPVYGEPQREDRQSLFSLVWYQRRSPDADADILFPAFWHVRDKKNDVTVVGPLVHREAPGENDNWLAPLYFQGSRKDGGYFHSLPLLTTSHWSKEKSFHLTFNYFHDRRGTDMSMGIVPFYFHGDNGNIDGARKKYAYVLPFYFHKTAELDGSASTVAGPVIVQEDEKRSIFDVVPFVFHISGKPETGGVHEEHTTVFPFVHWGYKEDERLFALPVYLHRSTATTETMLTPFFSFANTRGKSTHLVAAGPILPLGWYYRDNDTNLTSVAALPFYFHSESPQGHSWLTPLFGRFERTGVSRTYWTAPSLVISTDAHGWETDLWPIAFVGRKNDATHTVLAPAFWDFASPRGRTTIAPLYFRMADSTDDSILQVTGNTLYMQKRVAGGIDWQFHVIPVVSYGGVPRGHWWNFLFGLAGYTHDTDGSETVRALWLPIPVRGPDAPKAAVAKGTDALIQHF